MEAQLLKAIRESKKRLLPAIELQFERNPAKESVYKYLRVFSALIEIPLFVNRNLRFFLDGTISPNSKTGAAFREMTAAGISKNKIWYKAVRPLSGMGKLMRILFRIPWLLVVFVRNIRLFRLLDLSGVQVFVGYIVYKRFFERFPRLIPVIISDISPKLQMQWSAAIAIKRDVIWWQDDYHHYLGFSSENYMPYSCTYAVILNQKGLETVLQKNSNAKVYARQPTKVKPMKPILANLRLGVATNALFRANAQELNCIDKLRSNLEVNSVKIRLHPNSKITSDDCALDWLELAQSDESLDNFTNSVDLVVVGNSAIQLKLLCLGIPILHVPWLDPLGFDLYGYCSRKFVYGREYSKDISFKELSAFYSDTDLSNRLSEYVNINKEEKILPLSQLNIDLVIDV